MTTIPATLLLDYQIEYENTNITLTELCDKYSIDPAQLAGSDKWTKKSIVPIKSDSKTIALTEPSEPIDTTAMIDDFKVTVLAHAQDFAHNQLDYAEAKEIKDMVSIVETIEKSYNNRPDTALTINIAVQNLVERFNDDC